MKIMAPRNGKRSLFMTGKFVKYFGISSFIAMIMVAVPLMGGWGGGDGSHTSVAEPASVLLLGAGLVSLAVYAKKKNGKK